MIILSLLKNKKSNTSTKVKVASYHHPHRIRVSADQILGISMYAYKNI